MEHTPWLKSQLEIWRHKICEFHDLAGSFSTTFNDENYRYILYGMGHYPTIDLQVGDAETAAVFQHARAQAERAVAVTADHGNYLRQLNL